MKRLENDYVRPALRRLRPSKRVRLGGIDIVYRNDLTAAVPSLASNSFLSSNHAACRNESEFSSGAVGQLLLDFRCWETTSARVFV